MLQSALRTMGHNQFVKLRVCHLLYSAWMHATARSKISLTRITSSNAQASCTSMLAMSWKAQGRPYEYLLNLMTWYIAQ